jgi:hypothetical protein
VYDLFDVLLNSDASILLRIFASIFIKDIGLKFYFLVLSLLGFGMSIILASKNEFGSVLFLIPEKV